MTAPDQHDPFLPRLARIDDNGREILGRCKTCGDYIYLPRVWLGSDEYIEVRRLGPPPEQCEACERYSPQT